jgi:AcrR family transcriptional regulator
MVAFQRARSEEQREARRRMILDAAAAMLDEMPVSDISLNELSRRAGLAKSNVLRYFDSREAILLDLLDQRCKQWLADLDGQVTLASRAGDGSGEGTGAARTVRERGDGLAALLADSLDSRHVLCDLLSAQSSVLEHNVSAEVAIHFKRASLDNLATLAALVRRSLPELGDEAALRAAVLCLAFVTAAWPATRPSPSVLAAYEADPALVDLRIDFAAALCEATATMISGLLARQQS